MEKTEGTIAAMHFKRQRKAVERLSILMPEHDNATMGGRIKLIFRDYPALGRYYKEIWEQDGVSVRTMRFASREMVGCIISKDIATAVLDRRAIFMPITVLDSAFHGEALIPFENNQGSLKVIVPNYEWMLVTPPCVEESLKTMTGI